MSLKASVSSLKIFAPMPAPKAAPTLPSLLYNSTGVLVIFTKQSTKTSLKNIFALPARIIFGSILLSRIISKPYLKE